MPSPDSSVHGLDSPTAESRAIEQFSQLISVSNHLSRADSIDSLCQDAVQLGRALLGFDRISIWFVWNGGSHMRGSFGTDEKGNTRDERQTLHPADNYQFIHEMMAGSRSVITQSHTTLHDHVGRVVGRGDFSAAAMWDGNEVFGFVATDNLLTGRPSSDLQLRLLELFASMLGHLCAVKRTAAALRSSDSTLRVVLDTLPVGVWIMNNDQQVIDYNRAALDILDTDSPIRSEVFRQYPATWASSGEPIVAGEWPSDAVAATGKPHLNDEIELTTTIGRRKTILNSAVPIRDGDEQLGILVVHHDITSRRQREITLAAIATMSAALRSVSTWQEIAAKALQQIRTVLKSELVAIWSIDRAGGQLSLAEATAEFGRDSQHYRATIEGLIDEVLRSGVMTVRPVPMAERKHGHGIGQKASTLICVPMFAQGTIIALLVVGDERAFSPETQNLLVALGDVVAGALHRAELYSKLETQTNRLRSMIDAADIGLVLLDTNRRIIVANRRADETLAIYAAWDEQHQLVEILGEPVEALMLERTVHRLVIESPKRVIFEVGFSHLLAGDDVSGWVMTLQDVTTETSIQERIQHHERLAAVGQLAAGIAHDFNNIVAVIILYVQMLQEHLPLDPPSRERLLVIRDQAHYASSLIRQILDFSRQTLLNPKPVDLELFVRETAQLLQRTLPENISVELEVKRRRSSASSEQEFVAVVDINSLRQVLTNLAVNARDAMPTGGDLWISLGRELYMTPELLPLAEMTCGEWIVIRVTDSGEGIPQEVLPHIFDPFYTTKGVGKGTGLGLAQVYGIVRQHHGQIGVCSPENGGSQFTIYLPAAVDEDSAQTDPFVGTFSQTSWTGQTVLLVEDNSSAREATKAILEMLGYQVVPASNGVDALTKFLAVERPIACVLCDMVMPAMGGMELFEELRAHDPDIKMIIMTGYPVENGGRQLLEAGILSWIQKPFTIRELTEHLREHF